MKSITISPIHLGRYKIEIVEDNDEYHCVDGGSAYVMMFITERIFKAEHAQYMRDQRASSDAIARETLKRFENDPVLNPTGRKLLK